MQRGGTPSESPCPVPTASSAFTVVALLPAMLLSGSLKVRWRASAPQTAMAHGAAS